MLAEVERARDALHACDPSCSRDEWVRLAMGAKAAGLDFDAFDAWSAAGDNYSRRDARAVWHSIRRGEGIGPGTLFAIAQQQGWRPPQGARQGGAPVPAVRAAKEAPRPATSPRAGMDAAAVWGRCDPATAAHPYIVVKQGRPEGLRVVPEGDPLTVAGQRMAGALAVPVHSLDGELVSLQFIGTPEQAARWKAAGRPGKLNLPGAPLAGVHVVGALAPGAPAFLCEGIGQAWACWKATGQAAVVCFGWGRVRAVAAEQRSRDAAAPLVLVPDVGKEADAEAIAREVGGRFVALPAGWERNADVCDFALREGFDALEALLSRPQAPAQRFRLLTADELAALPPLRWRVKGLLPAEGLAAVFGPSGSGKSFLTLDLLASVAAGREWFGYRVEPCPVVYVALEGAGGLAQRVKAHRIRHGQLPAGFRFIAGEPFRLLEPADVVALAAAVRDAGGAGGIVCIDTLAQSTPGADENNGQDMTRAIAAAQALQAAVGGLVLLVHHTGKDASKGLRGHSSLHAALDAAIETERDGDRRAWSQRKNKDGDDGASHPFRLAPVEVGCDDDGEPVTSCVVEPQEAAGDAVRAAKLPQGGNQRIVWDTVGELLRNASTFGQGGAPAARPCVRLEDAIERCRGRLTCPSDRQAERARAAITGLVARRLLNLQDGWLWCP